MHKRIMQLAAVAALSAACAAPAFAHAVVSPRSVAPGYARVTVSIGHGCEGSPTKSVRVEIPEGYVAAKPMPKPGWTIEIERGDYAKPYAMHGKEIKAGPTAITWTGDLPDAYFDEFSLNGMFAGVEAGQKLYFNTTQTCEDGSMAWAEMAEDGEDPHALAFPAPFVTIAAAEGGMEGHDHMAMSMAGSETKIGDLTIEKAGARAMLPGQPAGGGYLTIVNEGAAPDRLVSASSPAAGKVEIHTMEMDGGVMKMRPLPDGLEIPAGGTVALEPGGRHLMFLDVKTPFEEGASVPVTLDFEKAGKVDVTLPVGPARGGGHEGHH